MVGFENIVLNQRIEVRMRAGVYKGTVKYKGPINGAPGDWIGVALDVPGLCICFHTAVIFSFKHCLHVR